jgi:cytochrome oxidase Cu insertion factor (SCO1/SenC/PrrC family)
MVLTSVLRILCCCWLVLTAPVAEAQLLSTTLANVELRDEEGDSLSLNDLRGRYVLFTTIYGQQKFCRYSYLG